ncbi:MAG: hypothetical protein ACK53F_12305 [Betaproteobacteria bacterium]
MSDAIYYPGIGFRVVGETFAALPLCERVVISAYSQRDDVGTGSKRDEYLYSAKFDRASWLRINFEKLEAIDVTEAFSRFELRREMSKTGVFKAIVPFDS